MATDDKLVQDVLEYLSELGEEVPGLRGLWSHPLAVATCIDSKLDVNRVRRLLEKLMRADLVRDCAEPAVSRNGRRGAPRRLFQITEPGRRALKLLEGGQRISLQEVHRGSRRPIPAPVPPKPARKKAAPGPAGVIPAGVNPFDVLYQAVEDYLEFAEPDMSEEYRVLEKAAALVRTYRANRSA